MNPMESPIDSGASRVENRAVAVNLLFGRW